MPWSKVTAGGSDTTWSNQTAGGSNTTWSGQTANGSNTTWSAITSGGSATTWTGGYSLVSVTSFNWVPLGEFADLWGGADFAAKASVAAPYKALSNRSGFRPIAAWNTSIITASGFTAERLP